MSRPGPRKVPPIFCFELKISIRSACKMFPPGRMNPSTYPRMGAFLSSNSITVGGDDADVDAGEDDSDVAVPRYPRPRTEKLSFIPLLDAKVVISSISAIVLLLLVDVVFEGTADNTSENGASATNNAPW